MTLWGTPPANYKKKIVYCLKPVDVKLEESKVGDMFDQVVVGDLNAGLLESLHGALRNVYLPIITNPKAGMLPEVIMHAFVDKYHATLASVVVAVGQTKGKTTLALPPLDVSSGGKHTAASEKAEKDRVHVLESAVVLWTNRINISLSLKPESAFDKGNHPAPEACLEFWQSKATDLGDILEQLNGPQIVKVGLWPADCTRRRSSWWLVRSPTVRVLRAARQVRHTVVPLVRCLRRIQLHRPRRGRRRLQKLLFGVRHVEWWDFSR